MLTPKRSIRCASFSQNVRDITTDYNTLANTCASLAFSQTSAAQQMPIYITNVQRTMSLDNMRRYSRYNIQLSNNNSLTAEQKQKLTTEQRPIVDKAITEYTNIATKYQTEVKTLLDKLDPTSAMQTCQTTAQTALISQINDASTLMAMPNSICDKLKSAYATYEKSIAAIYTKIGAAVPT